MRKIVLWVLAALAFVVLVFIIFLTVTSSGKDLQSKDAFIKELEAKGYKIQQNKLIKEDKKDFGVPRQFITSEDAVFNVYEFTSNKEAKLYASYISPSGFSIRSPKQSVFISWSDLPHYYCSGKLIVLYVGRDPKVLLDMRIVMGKQKAGAKWYEVLLTNKGK